MYHPSETQTNNNLPIVQNWLTRKSGHQRMGIFEYPLYTDVHVTGEVQRENWPYAFLNTVTIRNEPGLVLTPIIVRVDMHIPQSVTPNFLNTDTSLYHGGSLTDEIAAITSLCLGARIRAGDISRYFYDEISRDPLGRPVSSGYQKAPLLTLDKNNLVLPDIVSSKSLDELKRFEWLLPLTTNQAVSLVRAARLYQDALWIAESEPALAWLMFVSALETAANEWRTESGTLIERFEYSRPELVNTLRESGGDELVEATAKHIESSLGATKKFVNFTLEFLPPPPLVRPNPAFQIPWEQASMKKVLQVVYGYRSQALHGGTPFPAPMCNIALRINTDSGFSEKGTVGLAASSCGGVWRAEDAPISLHTFHYIVRGALLQWWEKMKNN